MSLGENYPSEWTLSYGTTKRISSRGRGGNIGVTQGSVLRNVIYIGGLFFSSQKKLRLSALSLVRL